MKPKFNNLPVESVRRITSSTSGLRRDRHKKITWHTSELYIRRFLTFAEYKKLTYDILKSCVTRDDDIMYEAIDYSVRLNIILAYALVELPIDQDDIEELYYIVYESDLYDVVCANANADQINSVWNTVLSYFSIGGWDINGACIKRS